MLTLKLTLARLHLQQRALAELVGVSPAAVAQWINYDQWPRSRDSAQLRVLVTDWLAGQGALAQEQTTWWQPLPEGEGQHRIGPGRGRGKCRGVRDQSAVINEQPEDIMLLRGQKLSEDARRAWGLFRDPFRCEIRESADLYIGEAHRYCREALWQTCMHGGMTAIIGESGSGKTTLRRDLAERIKHSGEAIIRIEPYVIDMDERAGRRLTLGARDIASSIVAALKPHESLRQDSQARFRQVDTLLAASSQIGNRHVLIIEEAHDIPTPTQRHLKRYVELADGLTPLLAVILLGQPELGFRLSELDASIREMVARCDVLHLAPLDARVGDYLRHKFARQGKTLDDFLEPAAVTAIERRLTIDAGRGRASTPTLSLVYPLQVNNLVTGALNKAVELGMPNPAMPRVTAELIEGV